MKDAVRWAITPFVSFLAGLIIFFIVLYINKNIHLWINYGFSGVMSGVVYATVARNMAPRHKNMAAIILSVVLISGLIMHYYSLYFGKSISRQATFTIISHIVGTTIGVVGYLVYAKRSSLRTK